MRRNDRPKLSEREIGRRLLRIYELNNWALPSRQEGQTKDEHRPQTPASSAVDARSTQQQS